MKEIKKSLLKIKIKKNRKNVSTLFREQDVVETKHTSPCVMPIIETQ